MNRFNDAPLWKAANLYAAVFRTAAIDLQHNWFKLK
jgi:hypothetical protein